MHGRLCLPGVRVHRANKRRNPRSLSQWPGYPGERTSAPRHLHPHYAVVGRWQDGRANGDGHLLQVQTRGLVSRRRSVQVGRPPAATAVAQTRETGLPTNCRIALRVVLHPSRLEALARTRCPFSQANQSESGARGHPPGPAGPRTLLAGNPPDRTNVQGQFQSKGCPAITACGLPTLRIFWTHPFRTLPSIPDRVPDRVYAGS